jgi:hypothetical protein
MGDGGGTKRRPVVCRARVVGEWLSNQSRFMSFTNCQPSHTQKKAK